MSNGMGATSSGFNSTASWENIPTELPDYSNQNHISQILVVNKDNNLSWRNRDLYHNWSRNHSHDGFTLDFTYYNEDTNIEVETPITIKVLPDQNNPNTVNKFLKSNGAETSWSEIPNELPEYSNQNNVSQLLVVDKDNNLVWRDRDLYEIFERNSTNDGFTFHHKYYKESTQVLKDDELNIKILPIQYQQGTLSSTKDKVLKSNGESTYWANDNNDNNEPEIDENQSDFSDDGKIKWTQKNYQGAEIKTARIKITPPFSQPTDVDKVLIVKSNQQTNKNELGLQSIPLTDSYITSMNFNNKRTLQIIQNNNKGNGTFEIFPEFINNKFLKYDEISSELKWEDPPTELPTHVSSDENRLLTVADNNELKWLRKDYYTLCVTESQAKLHFTHFKMDTNPPYNIVQNGINISVLPDFNQNSNKILALNNNSTSLVWVDNNIVTSGAINNLKTHTALVKNGSSDTVDIDIRPLLISSAEIVNTNGVFRYDSYDSLNNPNAEFLVNISSLQNTNLPSTTDENQFVVSTTTAGTWQISDKLSLNPVRFGDQIPTSIHNFSTLMGYSSGGGTSSSNIITAFGYKAG